MASASCGRRLGHSTGDRQIAELQAVVKGLTSGLGTIRLLEAGCGQYPTPLGLGEDRFVVGIDVSERQLSRNEWADAKILGDIQRYDFMADSFDIVACWDVLEHLPYPQRALKNFVHAVKPGGLVVVKVPNLLSGKGLITKLTPHRFHVWVYKHVFGYENPGTDDRPPFPTFLRRAIGPPGLRRFAEAEGLSVEMFGTWEADKQQSVRAKYRITGPVWRALRRLLKLLTFGRVDAEATELIVVFRKPELGPRS